MITKNELEAVKAKIIENPGNLQMSDWHCGTAHCIGGWLEILYPKKYKVSNRFINETRLSRNNFPDTLGCGNPEDRQSYLFAVSSWDYFYNKNKWNKITLFHPTKIEFDNLEPEIKKELAIIAIDSYIEKYNIN